MPRVAGITYSLTGDTLFGPITLTDGQLSPMTAVTYTLAGNKYIQLQYSVERNGQTRTGRLMIDHNGSIPSLSDESIDTSDVGVAFSAVVSGSDLLIKYTTTSTGFDATLKYYEKKWN